VGRLVGGLVSPFTQAAEAGVRYNMMMDAARSSFEGVAGDAELASKHVESLSRFADNKRLNFEGVLKGAQYMNIFGSALDEQIPKMNVWLNAVAANGKLTEDAIEGVVRGFSQMRSLGRVNAEEANQLAERGIPFWELLAKAIGKTVAETRKLGELGKLKGRESVEAVTAMLELDPRFQGQLERRRSTPAGQFDLLENIRGRAQGIAAQSIGQTLSETLEESFKQEGVVNRMAAAINVAITPVGKIVSASAKATLGGGLTGGFAEGIEAGKQYVLDAVTSLGLDSIMKLANVIGARSPATEFIKLGHFAALGFAQGLQDGLEGTFETDKRQIQRNLDWHGQVFKDKVKQIAEQLRTALHIYSVDAA
jgi:tape measure domain-containing protein